MQAFQIKGKTRGAPEKMVKTKIGKMKTDRKEQVEKGEKQTEEDFRERGEDAAAERIDGAGEKIVPRSADEPEKRTEQKGVEMAHFNSLARIFPPP